MDAPRPTSNQGYSAPRVFRDGDTIAVIMRQSSLSDFLSTRVAEVASILKETSILLKPEIPLSTRLIVLMHHCSELYKRAQAEIDLIDSLGTKFETLIEFDQHVLKTKGKKLDPERSLPTLPLQEVYSKIMDMYVEPEGDILEVGSGPLDKEGNSFLMRIVSEKIRKRIQPSDINVEAVKVSPQNALKNYDINTLSTHAKPNSLSCVIASNVLDELPNLDNALSEIYKVLKPNGVFIQLSDMPAYTNSMVSYYVSNGNIIFPYISEIGITGVYYIEKEVLAKYIHDKANVLGVEAQVLLKWFSSLEPKVLENMILHLLLDKKMMKIRNFFSNWIASLKSELFHPVNRDTFFRTIVYTHTIKHRDFEFLKAETVGYLLGDKMVSPETLRITVLRKPTQERLNELFKNMSI